jgi:hypothetical protein
MPYKDKAKRVAASLNWNNRHPERIRQAALNHYYRVRNEIIALFGGACTSCGFDSELELHHKDENGKAHRKEIKTREIYRWLKRHLDQKDKFELLCTYCHGEQHGRCRAGGNHNERRKQSPLYE